MLIILALGSSRVHSVLEKSKSAALHHPVGQLTCSMAARQIG